MKIELAQLRGELTRIIHMCLRRFHFERNEDKSGVSGCGKVATGVMFEDGQVALHWEGLHSSINIYRSIDDLLYVHGHNGATSLIWDDPPDSRNN